MKRSLTLLTALLLAPLAALHAADGPKLPPPELPASIRPDPKWTSQAAKDAKQDFTSIPFDGKTPDKLACDTTLRELPDGSWVMVMLGGGDREPLPQNQVFLTRSKDKGKTWSAMQPLDFGFPRKGDTAAMVPSELMVLPERCVLFFATHDGTFAGWKEWMTRSEDGCRTWSKPEPAPGRLHDRTFIRNHIVTRDGRILLPFQHYLRVAETKAINGNRRFSAPTGPRNGVLMSKDGGKTWTEHGDIRLNAKDTYHGWAENNIVELADGRIAMLIRADGLGGVLYYAESKDGGRTWPEFAVKSDIPNPGSKATLHPLGGDTVALLHNPNPKGRHPLALWISFDGMKTWPYQRVLVEHSSDGPGRSLNYPDGFVSKDKQWLHFAYDDARHRAVHYSAKLPPAAPHAAGDVSKSVAKPLAVQILAASAETPDRPYLAFPAILDLGTEVLVSFKHGRSHAGDADTPLEWLRYDKASGRMLAQGTLAEVKGEIMQMGEWVRFPNGDIANYIDAQKPKVLRTGLAVVRSTDGGRSFGSVQRVGPVDGVEYGYAFDAISRDGSTWMLVMTFATLPGGKLVYKYSSQPGSVDVIRSDDNGRTWRFVRSLTRELGGAPINESAFVAHGEGFLIASRGYDGRQWLLRTDAEFKVVAKTNLPAAHPFLKTMDRPRLFERDGSLYLLGRNRVEPRATELALFRFNPDTLAITRHVVLDTAADQTFAGDSFYAQPFWQERDGRSRFHIITYKGGTGPGLDIVRLEFDWEEVR